MPSIDILSPRMSTALTADQQPRPAKISSATASQMSVLPAMGSIPYWLRPNTVRLPPWPNRIPLTRGDSRTPVAVQAANYLCEL
jgi:hypothetical protein